LPKIGVYGTKTIVGDKEYVSVTNVGPKPTFDDDTLSVETLIKDFDGNIYGERIRVMFYKYLRDVSKFDDAEQLFYRVKADLEWEDNK
jgi:riboflavin kinase/FMN adenylyltransferase